MNDSSRKPPGQPAEDRAPLISFGNAQSDRISVGNVAGGNIINVTFWHWEPLGQDLLSRLALEQLLGISADAQAHGAHDQWAQIDWDQAAAEYCQEVQRLYGSMQIFGMSRPVPLDNVFTDVFLLSKPNALRRYTIEDMVERSLRHEDLDVDYRREGRALVAAERRLFILGQPGAGKTTFLKHLAMQAAQGNIDAIPIFISLKAWSDYGGDLLSFLARQFDICNFPHAQLFIEDILRKGQVLALFDGLDEVGVESGRSQSITREIVDFAQKYRDCQVVITCRTAATEYVFQQFCYCEMADFTQPQIISFVESWFQQDGHKRGAFLKAIAQPENQRFVDLARRPLLLTMLCLTFDETMSFPQRRAELYEEAIDALLKKWDSSRSIQRDKVYRKLSPGHKRQLLAELARETFERGELLIPRAKMAAWVVRFLRRLPPDNQTEDIDGEVVLRAIEAQHGLLIERASGIYSFSHLTFHEYFAARHIADHPDREVLGEVSRHAADPRWREVLLLTTSMLDHLSATRLFEVWVGHLHDQLIENPPLADLLGWVAQQAGAVAERAVGVRAAVLMFALINLAVQSNQQLIAFLEPNARDLIRFADFARALEQELSLAHREHIAAKALNPQELSVFCESLSTRASDIAGDLVPPRVGIAANTYASEVSIALAGAKISAQLIAAADVPPDALASIAWQHKALNREQLRVLKDYLHSVECLRACLDLAVIENRQVVLDSLLVAPER